LGQIKSFQIVGDFAKSAAENLGLVTDLQTIFKALHSKKGFKLNLDRLCLFISPTESTFIKKRYISFTQKIIFFFKLNSFYFKINFFSKKINKLKRIYFFSF
jgi:hypothetical protein